MNVFRTTIRGEDCICLVKHFSPFVPGRFDGPPDDCYPSEESEFSFSILNPDKSVNESLTLLALSDDEIFYRLQDEFEAGLTAEKYDILF